MARHTLEQRFEIWNDDTGERIDVGADRDSLGMVEIRRVSPEGNKSEPLTVADAEIPLLIEALRKMLVDPDA